MLTKGTSTSRLIGLPALSFDAPLTNATGDHQPWFHLSGRGLHAALPARTIMRQLYASYPAAFGNAPFPSPCLTSTRATLAFLG